MNLKISLEAARVNAHMRQGDVAKALGVSRQTVANWERGFTIPNALQFDALCVMYGISRDCIIMPTH